MHCVLHTHPHAIQAPHTCLSIAAQTAQLRKALLANRQGGMWHIYFGDWGLFSLLGKLPGRIWMLGV